MSKRKEQQTDCTGGSAILVGQRKKTLSMFLLEYNAPIILALMFIIASLISPIFLTKNNIINVFRQQTSYLIISMGMLVCLLTGGIDLSVASVVGFGSILVTELAVVKGVGIIPSILIAIVLSTLVGVVNGFLIAYLNMASFIVTLAMSFGVQGVVFIVTRGMNQMLMAKGDALIQAFLDFGQNSDPLLGIPWKVYLTALIVAFFWFLLKYTSFGRLCTATGSNATAVRLAGIDTRKYTFSSFVISSFLAGVTGVLITASNGASSAATTNGDYAMTAIAGTILGGADLGGGKGSVIYTVVGVFIMGLINNAMNLCNVPAYPQWCVKAAVILIAIFMRSVIDKNK